MGSIVYDSNTKVCIAQAVTLKVQFPGWGTAIEYEAVPVTFWQVERSIELEEEQAIVKLL